MNKKQVERPWLGIVEGMALAAAVSIAGILLFALLLKYLNLSDGVIPIVNQAIKVASILAGTLRAVKCGARGLVGGLAVGIGYICLGILIFSLIQGTISPPSVMLGDLALGAAAGGLSGILMANLFKR